ncbi:MAG TPA: lipid A biosynthesis lauroyl acyltransferase [Xanthobacteraceae bacterium]|nr:lipid A biosynthesis lauroyl acyltransferase [Xanthobacteraceae bacterium]
MKPVIDAVLGALTVALLRAVHWLDRRRSANFAGALMRKAGPLLKEHRLGRENLRAAYPEKSDAEIEKILGGVWDNLGRIAVEFAHLDEFSVAGFGPQTRDTITYTPETAARFERIRDGGQAMIGFAAHLANWEIPGVGATLLGVKSAVLYRRPGIAAIGDLIVKLRRPLMGELIPTSLEAPVRLARLLQSGVSVGILADQHYTRGVAVTFFGRPCLANPLVALLARQTGAPIHGMRVVRNPDGNSFWGEISDEVKPARDTEGNFDIAGTMQAVTAVIEGWVREHPEQWLWLHRRWR